MRFIERVVRTPFQRASLGEPTELSRRRMALLSENELFQGLDQAEMDTIAARLPMTTARPGQQIYTPNETGEALFILKAGHVRLYRIAPDGRKLVIALLNPGTAFGEMAVLGQSMTGSFAESADDCTLCIMGRVDVEDILMHHPAVALRMVRLLSSRLRESEDKLEQMAFLSVPSRLARLLLDLTDDKLTVGNSHQELADMVGTSRETVSRALAALKAAGIVALDRRCIRLLDIASLTEQAGLNS